MNPRFTQIESVLFSLFLGLENTAFGFESFDFYRLVKVTIKNQSPGIPPMLGCWNCNSINWMFFVSGHRRSA
jgi:hypothetical protein